jgi:hypothetical protein
MYLHYRKIAYSLSNLYKDDVNGTNLPVINRLNATRKENNYNSLDMTIRQIKLRDKFDRKPSKANMTDLMKWELSGWDSADNFKESELSARYHKVLKDDKNQDDEGDDLMKNYIGNSSRRIRIESEYFY